MDKNDVLYQKNNNNKNDNDNNTNNCNNKCWSKNNHFQYLIKLDII